MVAGAGLALEMLSTTLHFYSAAIPQLRNQPTRTPPALLTPLTLSSPASGCMIPSDIFSSVAEVENTAI